jgi:hypothetical protein
LKGLSPKEKLLEVLKNKNREKAENYHKALNEKNNPELIKDVESKIGKPQPQQGSNTLSEVENTAKALEELGQKQDDISEKNVTLQKNIQDAKDIITGKAIFERFSPQEQRGFHEGGTNHVEASLLLAADERASGKNNTTPEGQENRVEQQSKDKGIWVDNTTQSLTEKYGEPIASGEEAIVWADPENGKVIKTQDTFQYENLQQKLDGITLHNAYNPESTIKVLGFGRNSKGEFQVIVEQPFIQGEKLTPDEIHDYLESIGFKKTENDHYTDGHTIVEDVHTGNAVKTKEGNIVIIDPIMRLNTKELGYGGERQLSNKISEQPTKEVSSIEEPKLPGGQNSRNFKWCY